MITMQEASEKLLEMFKNTNSPHVAQNFGDPGGIRTPDPRLRRPLLYPTGLLDHIGFAKGDNRLPGWLLYHFILHGHCPQ